MTDNEWTAWLAAHPTRKVAIPEVARVRCEHEEDDRACNNSDCKRSRRPKPKMRMPDGTWHHDIIGMTTLERMSHGYGVRND